MSVNDRIVLNEKQQELKSRYIEKYVKGKSPLDTTCCLPKIFFQWVRPILKISQKVPFSEDMIYSVQKKRACEVEIVKFRKDFRKKYIEN